MGILTFYGGAALILWLFYRSKGHAKINTFLLTLMTVLVGTEYYELPIFICGYLGLFNHTFPLYINHLNITFMFILLVGVSQIKFRKMYVLLLVGGTVVNAFLLLPCAQLNYVGQLARSIGLGIFGGVFVNGSSLVGIES